MNNEYNGNTKNTKTVTDKNGNVIEVQTEVNVNWIGLPIKYTTQRIDILGNTPKIGDIISYNPAKYKGLVYGECIGFAKTTGLPIVYLNEKFHDMYFGQIYQERNHYVPKTGFVIVTNRNQ